jgi:hypothetical protein
MDKSWDNYEKMLKNLDKRSALAGKATAKQFSASFEKVSKDIRRQMEGTFKGIQNAGNRIKINPTVRLSTGKAMANIRSMEGAVDRLGKRMAGLVLGAGGGLLGGLGLAGAGKFGFNAASEYETAMTRLTTLSGPQAAKGIFANLQKFAAKTPYELKDVMDMFIRLQGAGFELADRKTGKIDYQKLVKLGDLAAASNKPLNELVDAILSSGRGLGSMVDNFIGLNAKAQGDGILAATMTDVRTGKSKNYSIDTSNKKQLFDFWLQAGNRQGIAGGMGALSQTLEGQTSTLIDSMKNLAQKAFKGFGPELHKALNAVILNLDKFEGQATRIGAAVGRFIRLDLPGWLNAVGKAAPFAAAGLAAFSFHLVGAKALAGYAALSKLGGLAKSLPGLIAFARTAGLWTTISTAFGALAGSTVVIGGGLVAIAGAALDFINYFQTGNSVLLDLTKKWPGLNKFIRDAYYNSKLFVFALQIGFENIGKDLTKLGKEIKIFGSNFATAWQDFVDNIVDYWKEKFGWMSNFVTSGPLGKLLDFVRGGGTAGGGAMASKAGLSLDSLTGPGVSTLVANARTVQTAWGRCMEGVGRAMYQTFGEKSTTASAWNKGQLGAAYMAADKLAKDPQFKELKFTPGQLKTILSDDKARQRLNSAVAIYDRGAYFSPKTKLYGHAEIWDTQNMVTNFGKQRQLTMSDNNLQHVRLFMPVGPSTAYDKNVGFGGLQSPQVSISIGDISAGPGSPTKQIVREIKQAAHDGVAQAMAKAAARQTMAAARQ